MDACHYSNYARNDLVTSLTFCDIPKLRNKLKTMRIIFQFDIQIDRFGISNFSWGRCKLDFSQQIKSKLIFGVVKSQRQKEGQQQQGLLTATAKFPLQMA